MYSLPQEIEVWYIIPAVRSEIAKVLVSRGFTQDKASKILGVSKAAVSQYISNKRASKVKFPKEVMSEIKKSVDNIIQENSVAVREIIRLLEIIKITKCSCNVCKIYNKGILNLCNMEPVAMGEIGKAGNISNVELLIKANK